MKNTLSNLFRLIKIKILSDRLILWIAYFILLDITIFPYFKYFIIPFSLPVVLFLIIFIQTEKDKYYHFFLLISICVGLSLIASYLISPYNAYVIDNTKRAFQLVLTFSYFFYFKWAASKVKINYLYPLFVYVVVNGILAHFFILYPIDTLELIRYFYGRLVTDQSIVLSHFRFAFYFADPNTASYFYLIAISLLLVKLRRQPVVYTILVSVSILIIYISQSHGALAILPLVIFFSYFKINKNMKISDLRYQFFKFVLIIFISSALFLLYIYAFDSSIVLQKSYTRLFDNNSYVGGGHRFKIWIQGLEFFNPLPIGRGYSLCCIDNDLYFPHTDILGILYRYGFIALVIMVIFFFGGLHVSFSLLLPAAAAFSINSLVDEQKLFSLFLVLLAFQISEGRHIKGHKSL